MKPGSGIIFFIFIVIQSAFPQKAPESYLIWDEAPHNAFTDIIRFNHNFYCVFREGKGHKPIRDCGKIRVLRSTNGNKWKSVAIFEINGFDLRDPKLSVTPDNRLMVLMSGTKYSGHQKIAGKSFVSFSENGIEFTDPLPVVIEELFNRIKFTIPLRVVKKDLFSSSHDWIWRVTWHDNIGYAVLYQVNEVYQDRKLKSETQTKLVKTTDGIHYYSVSDFGLDGNPNEASIRFGKDNKMFVVLRRENGQSLLGQSTPPYINWRWTPLDFKLGGPNLEILDDRLLCIGTRVIDQRPGCKNHQTSLFLVGADGETQSRITLESNGDTGYPGFMIYHRRLWISYYSSHNGKTSIYLCKIKVKDLINYKEFKV